MKKLIKDIKFKLNIRMKKEKYITKLLNSEKKEGKSLLIIKTKN